MANTYYTGIPRLQYSGYYPPCVPSITVPASKNPICLGDTVVMTANTECLDNVAEIGYGYLYNAFAINDARGLAGTGWHIATMADYATTCSAINIWGLKSIGYRRFDNGAFVDDTEACAFWSQDIVP
jgi:hypothetical protein